MNIKRIALSTAFLALCSVSVAANATIMTTNYMESFSFNSNNFIFDYEIGRETDGSNKRTAVRDSQIVSMSRFDSSLGELLDVNIWFESEWSLGGVVHAHHLGSGYQTVTGRGRSVSNQAIRLIDPNREIERNHEVLRLGCFAIYGCSASDVTSGSFDGAFDLSQFELSDFIGTDDLDFRVVRTLIADLTNCGYRDTCYLRNKYNEWGGNIFVSYTYSVPEPTSVALLGLGLLGLGASRLRKRNR